MPNSLKCRLKKLKHQGLLSEKDLSRLYTDNDVITELEKIKAKIDKEIEIEKKKGNSMDFFNGVCLCLIMIEDRISELKGE